MTERVIHHCGQPQDDDEYPVFQPNLDRDADYKAATAEAQRLADRGYGDQASSHAILALASQMARIADVLEFIAVSDSI